ncbi:unnamed protein product [Dovyalis caffra]|uniref:DUF7950 domain-containing protein n=1 Tax=Dovyalis caffra TaxID=77055 RepID=A0AAV1R625_9ROSI|nr:unnamed protein product [Dovyalis caffra]
MDGGDGWRVKACSSSVKDKTIINRVMLRFRPIAPKPVTGDSSYGNCKPEIKTGLASKERKKRKYVRVKKKNNSKEQYQRTRKKKMMPIISSDQEREREDHGLKLTLQLIPDEKTIDPIPEKRPLSNDIVSLSVPVVQHEKHKDLLFDINNQLIDDMGGLRMSDPTNGKRIVETRVTVESVTDTCMDMVLLGSTDVEKMRNLEKDTSPGFISDGLNWVLWVNDAYKKMVMVRQEDEGRSPEVSVDLVIKEKFLACLYGSAFTCWVRLQHTWQMEKCSQSQMVPCDVQKMEFGGFAWRLDVKAALSLGLN